MRKIKLFVLMLITAILFTKITSCNLDAKVEEPVEELVSIEISQLPNKTVYFIGQEFEPSGLVVNAIYSNGNSKIIDGYTLEGFDSSVEVDNLEIKVLYLDNEKKFETSFEISVVSCVSIELTHLPNKTEYFLNQEFDSSGLIVKAKYSDGNSKIIEDYTLEGFDSSVAVENLKIYVLYLGKIESFEISVVSLQMSVREFLTRLGKSVEIITSDEQVPGITFSEDGTSVNVSRLILTGTWDYYDQMPESLITADLSGIDCSYINGNAFSKCSNLTEITLPSTVTEIRDSAFKNYSSLTSVTIPDSVTEIGRNAFENCSSLTSVTIPDSVTKIGDGAFANCSSLISVTIPDSVTYIGSYAFENCSSLTSVTIPDSVTKIGDGAFANCSSLTSVTIPDSVTKIAYSAFANCSSLTSVTIPDSVTYIAGRAFENCSSLTSVTIPDSVTTIAYSAFENCSSLTSVTIPDSVTYIGVYTFANCSSLTSVTIPNSVTYISSHAFENCSSLTSVTIPDSVTFIDIDAFNGCNSLTSVKLLGYIKTMRTSFPYCKTLTLGGTTEINSEIVRDSLENLEILDGVTEIGDSAFKNCSSLTSVTIPDSVTKIGDSAFANCSSLTSVTIPDSVRVIGSKAFDGCNSLTSVKLLGYVENLYCSFPYCKTLTLGGTTKINSEKIGSSVEILEILDGVTTIDTYGSFKYRSNLKKVTIPDSVTNIEGRAFENCSSLTSVTIPDSVTYIGSYAFADCSSLTSVTIPNSVTEIRDRAFENCSSLTSVKIEFGVTTISQGTFAYCDNLVSVEIPSSVTSIIDSAFYGCSSLTSVTIPDSVTKIGSNAFRDVPKIIYSGTATGSPWGALDRAYE